MQTVKSDIRECRLSVKLKPNAQREAICRGIDADLVIAVPAPPVDNKANEAMVRLLAKTMRIGKTNITIIRGHTSRIKCVEISGMTKEAVFRALSIVDGISNGG